MGRNSIKLSKWDEAWLSDINDNKYGYVIKYIRVRWPPYVTQTIPPLWTESGDKQKIIRDLFCRLLNESEFDARGIIRRTKEAWRRYHNESVKKSTGNYISVKLTASDKKKMRVIAKEAGLSSVGEVVSSILNDEHKELLAVKKAERDMAAKDKALIKEKERFSGFYNNNMLQKLRGENLKLQQELEHTRLKLTALTDKFSQQCITLERYLSDGIAPLTDSELEQAQLLSQAMMDYFEEEMGQDESES